MRDRRPRSFRRYAETGPTRQNDPELASVIALVRAVRDLERNGTLVNETARDHLVLLADRYGHRAVACIEIILDYEERVQRFRARWRSWRKGRRAGNGSIASFAARQCAMPAYPTIEVLDAITSRPVTIAMMQVRAIYEAKIEGQIVTRIEYANGDTINAFEDCTRVLLLFEEALQRHGSNNVVE